MSIKIETRIWNDDKFAALSVNGKLAFFVLKTHPEIASHGVMLTLIPEIAEKIGMFSGMLTEALREVLDAGLVKLGGAASERD
jgi:hypothetical protein